MPQPQPDPVRLPPSPPAPEAPTEAEAQVMPLFKKDPGKVEAKRDAQSSVPAHDARMETLRGRRKAAQKSINKGGGPGADKKKGKK